MKRSKGRRKNPKRLGGEPIASGEEKVRKRIDLPHHPPIQKILWCLPNRQILLPALVPRTQMFPHPHAILRSNHPGDNHVAKNVYQWQAVVTVILILQAPQVALIGQPMNVDANVTSAYNVKGNRTRHRMVEILKIHIIDASENEER
jgi:hypothetical protein